MWFVKFYSLGWIFQMSQKFSIIATINWIIIFLKCLFQSFSILATFFGVNSSKFCTQSAYYFPPEWLMMLHVYDPFMCRELGLGHILGKLDKMIRTKLTWHTGLLQITLELFHLPLLMGLVQVAYDRQEFLFTIFPTWLF